jgi:hypothetical protein
MGQIPTLENIRSSDGPEYSPFSGTRNFIHVFITALHGSNQFIQNFVPNFFHVASSVVLHSMTVPHKPAFSMWLFEQKCLSNSRLSCVFHSLPIYFLISVCLHRRCLVKHKTAKLLIMSIPDRSGKRELLINKGI